MEVIMNLIYGDNEIQLKNENDEVVAEVLFPNSTDNVVNITRTFVDPSLRGKGVANKLLEAVAIKLREENKKAYPTCSYAVKWFERHNQYSDVYSDKPY